MVCLRTFGTSYAHIYGYNLDFLRAIGFPVGGGRGKGDRRKEGQICLMLYTCYFCQLRHPQMLGNPENTFKSNYEGHNAVVCISGVRKHLLPSAISQ